jgi:hypothetical protein
VYHYFGTKVNGMRVRMIADSDEKVNASLPKFKISHSPHPQKFHRLVDPALWLWLRWTNDYTVLPSLTSCGLAQQQSQE